MRKFKITEEQFKEIVNEIEVDINASAGGNPSNVAPAAQKAATVAARTGGEVNKVTISDVNPTPTTNEGKLISKKELKEMRLQKLKENSVVIPVFNLFK